MKDGGDKNHEKSKLKANVQKITSHLQMAQFFSFTLKEVVGQFHAKLGQSMIKIIMYSTCYIEKLDQSD